MRNFMKLVESALAEDDLHDKPVGVKDALSDLSFEPSMSKGALSAPAHSAPASVKLPGKKAGAAKTRRAISAMPPEASGHFANLAASGIEDTEMTDMEAARLGGVDDTARLARPAGADDNLPATMGTDVRPVTSQNLPAVINTAVSADHPNLQPEWHMVRDLPGYMKSAIRGLGRQIFSQFTATPIDDIQVLSTLSNSEVEVKGMMAWIKHNGVRDDQAVMDFERIMPGYHAEIQLWNSEGYTFLLVKDFGGYYVYGWPGGRGTRLATPGDRLRLNHMESQQVTEISDEKKDKYLDRATTEHGMANFAKRQTTNPKEKAHYERIEKNRKKGISRALKDR